MIKIFFQYCTLRVSVQAKAFHAAQFLKQRRVVSRLQTCWFPWQTDNIVHYFCVAEVFESETANSSFLPSNNYGEETDGAATPARPRTTEDLFAAIHRYCRDCPFLTVLSIISLKN